ncbi:MAG: helix-turn-helix domain-containing protein, partial [Acidimicrobiales bacterium]
MPNGSGPSNAPGAGRAATRSLLLDRPVKYRRAVARRLTPRGEQRREQLMAYAIGRFASHGYHTTSVAEIVEGIGVGKGVFYWYFDSK